MHFMRLWGPRPWGDPKAQLPSNQSWDADRGRNGIGEERGNDRGPVGISRLPACMFRGMRL
jgi:hypothetical protein